MKKNHNIPLFWPFFSRNYTSSHGPFQRTFPLRKSTSSHGRSNEDDFGANSNSGQQSHSVSTNLNKWLMTTWWLLDDCVMTALWLPDDARWLADDCLMTAWWLPDKFVMTVWWLSDDCQMTDRWLPDDWQITVWWLPDALLVTSWWLPDDCQMTVWRLYDDFLMTNMVETCYEFQNSIHATF